MVNILKTSICSVISTPSLLVLSCLDTSEIFFSKLNKKNSLVGKLDQFLKPSHLSKKEIILCQR